MKISLSNQPVQSIEADLEIIFVVNRDLNHKWVKKYAASLSRLGFKGEAEELFFLNESGRVLVALESLNSSNVRLAASAAVKAVKGRFKTAKMGRYLDPKDKNGSAEALFEGLLLADYRFETYKSKKDETGGLEEIIIAESEYSNRKIDTADLQRALDRASAKCEVVNLVRDIVNTPPEEATPVKLAGMMEKLAAEYDVSCEIKDENWIRETGMGAFYAVGKGSANPPRYIHLSHHPAKPRAKVVVVGKGLTYDSGGLSLKPTTSMTTMKADKAGGVTAMGIVFAAAKLGLEVEVHALIGAAENMVSGTSYRPDDVVTALNGKTIEVKNTDAEGRLVLADCLCRAQELKPDYIIDIATLTGACVVALGEHIFGILGHSEGLKNELLCSAVKCGEGAHTLPFDKHLKKMLKSDIADVSNITGSKWGGALSAGLFLSEFVTDEYRDRWAHLDIAGPAFVEKEWDYNPAGASGAGLRTVLTWIEGLSGA
jgi:leucyl aminopeptidase